MGCCSSGGEARELELGSLGWFARGLARGRFQCGHERRSDGVVSLSEDHVTGLQVNGGGSEHSFTRRRFGFAAEGAVERAAMQDESVELLEFAVREERVFSQAAGPRGVVYG